MPVENFIRFQGMCYDVGTRLKFRTRVWGLLSSEPYTGTIEKFDKTTCFIRGDDGNLYTISTMRQSPTCDNEYIVQIITSVYYVLKASKPTRRCPSSWNVEAGWIWYIIIMAVGTIFKARLILWIFATAFFFLWKNGLMSNKD